MSPTRRWRGSTWRRDLEKFFDRVNHDILMARLPRRVADKRWLRIVRRFLEAALKLRESG